MKYVQTEQAPQAIGPYAQAVIANGHVYTSGQLPMTKDGVLVKGTIQEQTRQVFANLRAILEAAGTSLDQVIKVTVYMKDMRQFAEMNEVYAQQFGAHTPARSTVEVARLPKDAPVEIEVIATV